MKKALRRFWAMMLSVITVLGMIPAVAIPAYADYVAGIPTDITVEYNDGTWSKTSDSPLTIFGSATGSGGCGDDQTTSTVTITNNTGATKQISFSYSGSIVNAGSLKIDGILKVSGKDRETTQIAETTYTSGKLKNGESVRIELKSGTGSASTSSLTLSNIVLLDVYLTVTFQPDENGTYTVNGTMIDEEQAITATSFAVKATPADRFVAWIDANTGEYFSQTAECLLPVDEGMKVKPTFVSENKEGWFCVGKTLYSDLTLACNAAANGGTKTVVLVNNGILTGNHTIPSGVTLLIPFDDAHTLYTNVPGIENSYTTPTAYRTLTMASGASITVNGAMSVSGKQSSSNRNNGAPHGPQGFVKMNEGSSITVENGGNLYAWGYIVGNRNANNEREEGSVVIKPGGTVYEDFQFRDWRGGGATTTVVSDKNKSAYRVFPFSQYYVQNVQVPMTLYAGATEKAYTSVSVSMAANQGAEAPFIGDDGMFRLVSGCLIKDYDETNDRLVVDLAGDVDMSALNVTLRTSVVGSVPINSADYVLPITNNITLNILSGSLDVTQDAALLPGAEINISSGAKCTLGNNVNFYVYDADEWSYTKDGAINGYCSEYNYVMMPVRYAYDSVKRTDAGVNSVAASTDAKITVNGEADASAGYVYTTKGKANICSDGGGIVKMRAGSSTAKTYQVIQVYTDSDIESWPEIPITSAQLKNSNGSYVETNNIDGIVTYKHIDGFWLPKIAERYNSEGAKVEDCYNLTNAATAANGSGYIKMVMNATDSVSASKDTYIDLNGTTLTLTGLSGNVRFMDKSTDGYKDGNGRVIGAAVANLPAVTDFTLGGIERHYLKVDLGSNTYAFPRVAVAVTGIGYRSNSVGSYLTFQQTYRGNSLATGKLTDVGFGLDTTETWLGTANLSKIDQDQDTDGFTIRSHYDTAVPSTLYSGVKAMTKFNADTVESSLDSTALDLAYQAFGLKEAS